MGEAKWRRENDPSFGQPKEASGFSNSSTGDERGLVICNPIEIRASNSVFMKSSDLDADELRFSLLYWDKLVWPQNRAINIGGGPDAQFLEQAGILSRPFPKTISNTEDVLLATQVSIFEEFDSLQPGQWAIAQGERSLSIHPDFQKHQPIESLLIELHRAIPIPKNDVPLAEILEFKERRRDELLLLRKTFEALTVDISNSEDPNATLQQKLEEIDRVCANLLEVGREWQWPINLGSWNASFSIDPIKLIERTRKAAEFTHQNSLNLIESALIIGGAAIMSTISFKPSTIEFQNIRRPIHPYRYAYSIDSELN